MIRPIEIFSPDPGRIMDFSGVPVAEIFNGSVVARSQAMEREQPEEPELAPAPSITPQSLFGTERGADLFSMPKQSNSPAPGAARSSVPGEYPDMGIYDAPIGGGSMKPEDFIFESEARRDGKGRLQVYTPPSGDGGGSFEVAGITARYQPKEAARLKALLEAGQSDQAEAEAKDFYRRRAAPFTRFTDNPGLQLQLADTVHHRGEGGLRRVLQRATGSGAKDYGELIGTLGSDPAALDKFNSARQDYEWEEVERGRASRKKFRPGLQNRFNKADAAARRLITGE